MSKVIVIVNSAGELSIVAPAKGVSVDDLIETVVPRGATSLIVSRADVPTAKKDRVAWANGLGLVVPEVVANLTRDLTLAEFNGMMAAKGLDVIWSAMQAALVGATGEAAEELRFQLASNLHAKFYNLEATLLLVGQFRSDAVKLNADYAAMLTDDNITAAWRATVARRDGVTS